MNLNGKYNIEYSMDFDIDIIEYNMDFNINIIEHNMDFNININSMIWNKTGMQTLL